APPAVRLPWTQTAVPGPGVSRRAQSASCAWRLPQPPGRWLRSSRSKRLETPVGSDEGGLVAHDGAEDAVDELRGLVGGEVADQGQRLADGDGVGYVVDVQQLEDTQSQHVAVDGGHPVEGPALGVLRQHLVDAPL